MIPLTNHAITATVKAVSLPLVAIITLTKAGPSPFPSSSERLKTPKAIPRVEGKVTFLENHRKTVITVQLSSSIDNLAEVRQDGRLHRGSTHIRTDLTMGPAMHTRIPPVIANNMKREMLPPSYWISITKGNTEPMVAACRVALVTVRLQEDWRNGGKGRGNNLRLGCKRNYEIISYPRERTLVESCHFTQHSNHRERRARLYVPIPTSCISGSKPLRKERARVELTPMRID